MKTITFNTSNDYLECSEISPILTTIGFYWKCFRFFSQNNDEKNNKFLIDFDVSIRENRKPMIYFNVSVKMRAFAIYMHTRFEMLRDFYGDNQVSDYLKDEGLTLIKYHKTITRLMPKPYRTECVDYKQFGYKSRIGCNKECVKNYFIKYSQINFISHIIDSKII